jgi:hypothetical protein
MKKNLRLAVLLLNLMTNAPPETRFFLLVWAAHVEKRASSKVLENLIAMGMPKRCIPSTLEYLVREGFMWKVKSSKGRTARNKYLGGFDFSLTDKCFSLFQATLDKIIWTGEFLYLLNCPSIAGSNSSKNLNLEMRLIWIWLVTQSNQAGFIVGFDHQTASAVLGMPVSKVTESFNSLLEKNHVSQLSIKIPRSKLFDELLPIYKIYPAKSDRKIVQLGVPNPRFINLKSLGFLIHMFDYQSKPNDQVEQATFPTQISGLPYADYYELSEILENHDLIEALEWRAMLTMLLVIPEYASFIECAAFFKLVVTIDRFKRPAFLLF